MIYFSGLDSIVESLYLGEVLDDRLGSCKIFVNPSNISYLTGRVVIINSLDYSKESIITLLNNMNKVISRVDLGYDISGVQFEPYIIRPNFDLMWGGDELRIDDSDLDNLDYVLDKILDSCSYVSERGKLFFPKLIGSGVSSISIDRDNNLTFIGYALQQVGVNIRTDIHFLDLDILKTKKLSF